MRRATWWTRAGWWTDPSYVNAVEMKTKVYEDGGCAMPRHNSSASRGSTQTHWIFGYGSIMSEASRLSTLTRSESEQPAPAALVELSAEAGFVREWNFRAPSGFTAVGMRYAAAGVDVATEVSGILFEAGTSGALNRFDAREKGYDRVALKPEHVRLLDAGHPAAAALGEARAGDPRHWFWTYVPCETAAATDEVGLRSRPHSLPPTGSSRCTLHTATMHGLSMCRWFGARLPCLASRISSLSARRMSTCA